MRTEEEDRAAWREGDAADPDVALPPMGLSVCFMKEKAFAHAAAPRARASEDCSARRRCGEARAWDTSWGPT